MKLGREPGVVLDCRNNLGESIVWDERTGRLWWANIHAGEVWNWDPFGPDAAEVLTIGDRVGAIGLRAGHDLVLALEKGFAFYDPKSGVLQPIGEVETDLPTTRLNDGRIDPAGRFLCGGMDEATPQRHISAVYSLDPDGTIKRRIGGVACANSTCWSPDGRTLYFANMPLRRIDAYDYDVASGEVSNPRLFASLEGEPGLADGSAVDAEGYLWNAQWGGGKLVRYAPDGTVDRQVALPVTNPTCLAFGGPDLDILFVTSAWLGLDDAQRAAEPLAGSLFAFRPGVRGLPEHRFTG